MCLGMVHSTFVCLHIIVMHLCLEAVLLHIHDCVPAWRIVLYIIVHDCAPVSIFMTYIYRIMPMTGGIETSDY